VKNDRQLQSDVEQELRWDPGMRAETAPSLTSSDDRIAIS
jgi:hypothetical protein